MSDLIANPRVIGVRAVWSSGVPDHLQTTPQEISVSQYDVIPLTCDMTALLQVGDTVTSPVCYLTDTALPYPVTLSDAATVSGSVVTQIIRGSELTPGHSYTLVFVFTASSSKTLSVYVQINCSF